jgi:hypothetical protein
MNVRADAIHADNLATQVVAGDLLLAIGAKQHALARTGPYRVERIERVSALIQHVTSPMMNSGHQDASYKCQLIGTKSLGQKQVGPHPRRRPRGATRDFRLKLAASELPIGVQEALDLILCSVAPLLARYQRQLEVIQLPEGALQLRA